MALVVKFQTSTDSSPQSSSSSSASARSLTGEACISGPSLLLSAHPSPTILRSIGQSNEKKDLMQELGLLGQRASGLDWNLSPDEVERNECFAMMIGVTCIIIVRIITKHYIHL